ncbi:hypothetical protein LEMLEM_LOCUS1886, partial [Lemmus lemmus]
RSRLAAGCLEAVATTHRQLTCGGTEAPGQRGRPSPGGREALRGKTAAEGGPAAGIYRLASNSS